MTRGYRVCVPVSPFFVLRGGEYGGKGRIYAGCRGFIKRKPCLWEKKQKRKLLVLSSFDILLIINCLNVCFGKLCFSLKIYSFLFVYEKCFD